MSQKDTMLTQDGGQVISGPTVEVQLKAERVQGNAPSEPFTVSIARRRRVRPGDELSPVELYVKLG